MTIEEAKVDLEKFVRLKTTMRPAFLDVILNALEEKQGYWVQQFHNVYKCSNCGFSESDILHSTKDWAMEEFRYCPYCGAKMLGVK